METIKRTKILVGVNTLTSVDQAIYSNHCQFWFRLGRTYQDCDFAFYTPRRASIDRMRNEVAKLAISHEFDYILFLDDDVLIPHEGLAALIHADADIAAGWTIIRGYPFDNMFFKYTDEEHKSLKKYNDFVLNEKGLIECDAVGFSFCLLKVSLLKKVPPPFFITGPHNTEDVYFCIKARVHNPECTIIVDPNVKTGHCLGSEFIDPINREYYIDFLKNAYPEQIQEDKPLQARGDGYLKMVEDPSEENIKAHRQAGE
jgi:hypothetical protein